MSRASQLFSNFPCISVPYPPMTRNLPPWNITLDIPSHDEDRLAVARRLAMQPNLWKFDLGLPSLARGRMAENPALGTQIKHSRY
ncbi:hypothetical protein NL676_006829 [Syzygium grande]|nr:hypothetical protein NL676_006829 [Syzygium grande]